MGAGITFNRRMAAWWPGLKITVDGYVNRIKDKITSVPINLHVWRTVNLGEVHARGIDINLESRFLPARKHMVTLSGNYTLQHVVDKTFPGGQTYNKQLPYLPRYSGWPTRIRGSTSRPADKGLRAVTARRNILTERSSRVTPSSISRSGSPSASTRSGWKRAQTFRMFSTNNTASSPAIPCPAELTD